MKRFIRNETGLTLIEVLIALAILSIALTAIIKSASQNIRGTLYLQNRTIATWVGYDAINNIRAGVITVPAAPDHLSRETDALEQRWAWEAQLSLTPNPHIKKVTVDVFHQPNHEKLAHLESYLQ